MYPTTVRILITDNDRDTQQKIADALTNQGFMVHATATLEEASNAIAANQYELIVTDLSLPDGSGMTLLETSRAGDESPAAIILSSQPSLTTVRQAILLGANDYLIKPIRTEKVVEAVQDVLAKNGLLILSEDQLVAELGTRLRHARRAGDMTMRTLGERIGISQAQISQIESGISAPSLATLFRMSRALQIKLSDIFGGC